MLTRKPKKGDRLQRVDNYEQHINEGVLPVWLPLGTVTRTVGNLCYYKYDGRDDKGVFIWWFEADKAYNRLVRFAA